MANRFWVGGSGSWTDTSHWSTSSGGSGGASVPGIPDDVYFDENSAGADYEVTLSLAFHRFRNVNSTSPYEIAFQTSGNSYRLVALDSTYADVTNFFDVSITVDGDASVAQIYKNTESTVSIILQGDTKLNTDWVGGGVVIGAGNHNINNKTLDLSGGDLSANGNNLGSVLTSGILVIKSGVSLIYLDIKSTGTLYIGGSSINRNTITIRRLVSDGGIIQSFYSGGVQNTISITGSNQLVALSNVTIKDTEITGSGTYYAGSGSTDNGNNSGWLFTDAPEIETLIDTFASGTINSTKWATQTFSGGSVSQSSGLLTFSGTGGGSQANLISQTQYVGEGSYMRFGVGTVSGSSALSAYFAYSNSQYGIGARLNIPNILLGISGVNKSFVVQGSSTFTHNFTTVYNYYQIRESGGTIYLDGSTNGINYTNITSAVLATYGIESTQLLARPVFQYQGGSSVAISEFNIDLTPTTDFTATPLSGNNPLTVNFTDISNFGPDTWDWDFGDGNDSTEQNPEHTYNAVGTYTVSLLASNDDDSDTDTKVDYITVSPNTYTRSISGTLLFGGSVTREVLFEREISGTLLFGGGAFRVLIKDTESIEEKRYLYKVYDDEGNFIEAWRDVISEATFTQELNQLGSEMNIELARNSDSLGVTTAPLLTEGDEIVDTESDLPILVATKSKNQIGPGSSVVHNNRVDVWVYYGSVEALLTEDGDEILTEDDEPILAALGAPNGRRIFTGFIAEINSRYGSTETTTVKLMSYGWDLGQYVVTNDSDETTVQFTSDDPSEIARDVIDRFVIESNLEQVTYTTRTDTSISNTGTVVTYTFRNNTYADALRKIIELMPSNWFFYVDLGENVVYYRERQVDPQHTFYLGKHLSALELKSSIHDSLNRVLVTGGGDPQLFRNYTEMPVEFTRRALQQYSDGRLENTDSADIIGESIIEDNNKIKYRSTIEILTKQYDIESIDVGDVIGFRNFGNYVDLLTMMVVGRTYTPDTVQLQLETKPPTINKRLQDLQRNLLVQENQNIPEEPTEPA